MSLLEAGLATRTRMLSTPLVEFPLVRNLDRLGPTESILIRVTEASGNLDRIVRETAGVTGAIEALRQDTTVGLSGLSATISTGFEGVSASIDALTDAVWWGFETLAGISSAQLELLEQITDILSHPTRTKVEELRRRGVRRFEAGLLTEAIEDFQEMLTLDRTDFHALLHIGHVHLLEGRVTESTDAYLNSERYAESLAGSEFWAGLAALGAARAFAQAGDKHAALSSANRAVERLPGRADALLELVRVATLSGDPKRSTDALVQALRLDPVLVYAMATMDTVIKEEEAVQLVLGEASLVFELLRNVAAELRVIEAKMRLFSVASPGHPNEMPDSLPQVVALNAQMHTRLHDDVKRLKAKAKEGLSYEASTTWGATERTAKQTAVTDSEARGFGAKVIAVIAAIVSFVFLMGYFQPETGEPPETQSLGIALVALAIAVGFAKDVRSSAANERMARDALNDHESKTVMHFAALRSSAAQLDALQSVLRQVDDDPMVRLRTTQPTR